MDPQQRILLEVSGEAICGPIFASIDKSRMSVMVGVGNGDYQGTFGDTEVGIYCGTGTVDQIFPSSSLIFHVRLTIPQLHSCFRLKSIRIGDKRCGR
jgi:Beta-ketoacyl synthase, N-terminal domain